MTASPIRPATRYDAPDDLWVISCYFNPARFASKRANYDHFAAALAESSVHHLIVECAFQEEPYELPESPGVLRVRARDVMWQKERLLNVAMQNLPVACTKVAWLDCDVLFANPAWATAASALLDEVPIVQLFDSIIRLPKGHTAFTGEGDVWPSFASVYRRNPHLMLAGDFAAHGHTGFGWAARREILQRHGFYDACISGSGDHMMAHAFCGDWEGRPGGCIERILGRGSPLERHFVTWCKAVYRDVRARVGVTPGTLLHLWHGETENRRYVLRNRELSAFDFDPDRDLRVGESGAWEWNSDKPDLHRWAIGYYPTRKEDG